MTIIVWDGKTLVADKRAVNNGLKTGTVTKIHRFDGGICGFSGDLDIGMAMVEWLRAGAVPADYPKKQETNACNFMVVMKNGEVFRYETVPVPLRLENQHQAMGSGRDYALAALYLGHGARKAADVACALDSSCGNGIDTLTLE
jgi:hypothetical protein